MSMLETAKSAHQWLRMKILYILCGDKSLSMYGAHRRLVSRHVQCRVETSFYGGRWGIKTSIYYGNWRPASMVDTGDLHLWWGQEASIWGGDWRPPSMVGTEGLHQWWGLEHVFQYPTLSPCSSSPPAASCPSAPGSETQSHRHPPKQQSYPERLPCHRRW